MDGKIDQVILPGDVIGTVASNEKIRLGPGLRMQEDSILSTRAGILRKALNKYWVETTQKRYLPAVDDMVVAIVTERSGQGWKLDIGCQQLATLSIYSFEGGTKKNRPNLPVGSLVYTRICVANKDVEPECSCVATNSLKAEGFGPLVGGYMFKCSTGLARQCLASDSFVLNELGKYIPFEIAVGVNGRIWINSLTISDSILVMNVISNSEFLNEDQIGSMIKKLLHKSQEKIIS